MSKWIEDFKNFVKGVNEDDKEYFVLDFENKCDEKGYSYEETEELVKYVFE